MLYFCVLVCGGWVVIFQSCPDCTALSMGPKAGDPVSPFLVIVGIVKWLSQLPHLS